MSRIHIVGVGGPGMSAIATVLAQMGNSVSGSDLCETEMTERLRDAGVRINIGHDASVVRGCDLVAASTAVPDANIELVAARDNNIFVQTRAEILASICAQKKSVAVAGTHGKTTTASMLMLMLLDAGVRPSFIIGGVVADVGCGARWDDGEILVVEADESDGTHMLLPVRATILTNIDVDHLDHFANFAAIVESFDQYLGNVTGPKVLCGDDANCAALAIKYGARTYGIDSASDVIAADITFVSGGAEFDVLVREDCANEHTKLGRVAVHQRGRHNVLNALGAATMAMQLGVDFASITKTLARFSGVDRRFDYRGRQDGVTFVDDYAHLPTEIAAVLSGARDGSDTWSRIVAVFQPNRFNRMAVMSQTYADAFVLADVVVITDIYSSGTTKLEGVTGKLVVDAISTAHQQADVQWLATREQLVDSLAKQLRDGDLCLSMGCGDISTLPDEVMARRADARRP